MDYPAESPVTAPPTAPLSAAHRELRKVRRTRRFPRLAGACLACALWPVTALVQELIANQDSTQVQLTRNEARLYFTLRLQEWPSGRPIRVFVLPDVDPLHGSFAKDILELFPYQLRNTWDRQVFSGTGQAPITVANEADMVQRVATTPGAIGYSRSKPGDPRVRTLDVR